MLCSAGARYLLQGPARKDHLMNISGSLPVIPTPFYQRQIDYESLSRLFDYVLPELEGFTLCGSTGESVSLSFEERVELMEFALRRVRFRHHPSLYPSVWAG